MAVIVCVCILITSELLSGAKHMLGNEQSKTQKIHPQLRDIEKQ